MIIKIHREHLAYLAKQKIFLASSGAPEGGWIRVGADYNTSGSISIEPYSGVYIGPRLSSIGSFGYTKSYFPPQLFTIGRYCAIADRCEMMGLNHPTNRLSMSGIDYSRDVPFRIFERDQGVSFPKKAPGVNAKATIIGNDVWMGSGVLVRLGVTIGDGAVIAARSIIVKDVPPYAVVAGSPAIVKKYRFDDKMIERLLISKWWRYAYTDFVNCDTTDPYRFIDQFDDLIASGRLKPYSENRIDVHSEFRRIHAEVEHKMNEDKRVSSRRKKTRRMYDALHGKITEGKVTEEERRHYDKLLWSRSLGEDRRTQERRSGEDRRG